MSAGLPGFGLGGLLFVVCALLGPIVELTRMARGTSRAGAWGQAMRQFAIALSMVAVFELARRAVSTLVSGEIELSAIAFTALALAAVLVAAKALQLVFAMRRSFSRRSDRVPGRYSPASRLVSDQEG